MLKTRNAVVFTATLLVACASITVAPATAGGAIYSSGSASSGGWDHNTPVPHSWGKIIQQAWKHRKKIKERLMEAAAVMSLPLQWIWEMMQKAWTAFLDFVGSISEKMEHAMRVIDNTVQEVAYCMSQGSSWEGHGCQHPPGEPNPGDDYGG